MFSVLEGLETVATRLVATRADRDAIEQLGTLVDTMDRALEAGDTARWAEINRRFHLAISALPALPLLREMTERVLDRWDRVRRFYVKGVLDHRVLQAQQEHRALLDAMRAGDLTRLQQIVREHNQGAMESYLAFLDGGAAVAT